MTGGESKQTAEHAGLDRRKNGWFYARLDRLEIRTIHDCGRQDCDCDEGTFRIKNPPEDPAWTDILMIGIAKRETWQMGLDLGQTECDSSRHSGEPGRLLFKFQAKKREDQRRPYGTT